MVLDTSIVPLSLDERFALLYSWRDRVRPYVVALVGSQDAEDVMQQCYLNAWRVLAKTEIITVAWLRQIATNAALDHLRRLAARSRHASSASIDDAAEFLEAGRDSLPDAVTVAREDLASVCKALEALPADDRRLLLIAAAAGDKRAGLDLRREMIAKEAKRRGKTERELTGSVYRSRKKMKERLAV